MNQDKHPNPSFSARYQAILKQGMEAYLLVLSQNLEKPKLMAYCKRNYDARA